MGALEQNLEGFLDNNTPGGYIQTNISISNNDIENIITEKINNRGFLTTETDPTVPAWAKAARKPTYTATEVGAMPVNGITISNTLNEGTVLATITINGVSTDIKGSNSSGGGGNGGGIITETDPLFTASPAATITNEDIANWNHISYDSLEDKPTLPFIRNYDLNNFDQVDLQNLLPSDRPLMINTTDLIDINNNTTVDAWLNELIQLSYNTYDVIAINLFTTDNIKYTISQIYSNLDYYTFCFYSKNFTNFIELKNEGSTDAEILESLEINGADTMVWEYDPIGHKLFIL